MHLDHRIYESIYECLRITTLEIFYHLEHVGYSGVGAEMSLDVRGRACLPTFPVIVAAVASKELSQRKEGSTSPKPQTKLLPPSRPFTTILIGHHFSAAKSPLSLSEKDFRNFRSNFGDAFTEDGRKEGRTPKQSEGLIRAHPIRLPRRQVHFRIADESMRR